jgi:tRNA A37 threonylcarbamoyladenosine synthetase subunit TsaC/SUA5/YrdC
VITVDCMSPSAAAQAPAVEAQRAGQVVAFPTDTHY